LILKNKGGVEKCSLMEIHFRDILRMDCLMEKGLIVGMMEPNMRVSSVKDIEMVEVF